MSSTLKRLIITGAFLMLVPSICLAVPKLINYQGRLTDSGGVPVNGDKPVVFSIYTSASGSTALWSESRTVTVADGAFSVELGEVTPIPDTVFQTDEVYLGVTVDTDNEMTPRTRLTSIGYSYRAGGVNVTSTGDDAPVFVNMSGSARAGDFNIINSGSHSSALHASTNGGAAAISCVTTGTSNAGNFRVHNTGNLYHAVYAATDGGGDAIKCEVTGTGKAGEFRVLNPSSTAAAVYGLNNGTGNAGYFLISSTGSAAPAVYANTLGTGPAGKFDGDVQVNGALSATSVSGDGTGLSNVNAVTATNADNAALLNSMTSSDIIDAASDEVRIPISSVPFTIMTSMSGKSFYFTGDLDYRQTTGNAITVEANDVTIDMMGYSLKGPGKASGDSSGIYTNNQKNVEIKNGTVRDFGYFGIAEYDTSGQGHSVVNVRSVANGLDGIYMQGTGHLIKNCIVSDNGGKGILTDNCCIVTGNISFNNSSTGIYGNTGVTIDHNTVYGNNHDGIFAATGCMVTGNTVSGNNRSDINGYAGIDVSVYNTLKGNMVYNNSQSNIYISSGYNTVEENYVAASSTGFGIFFIYANNFYANNRASGNSTNYGGSLPSGQGDGGGNVSF